MIRKKDVESPSILFTRTSPPPAPEERKLVAERLPSRPKVAILTVHGMGQQVAFQTLDAIAEGLNNEDKLRRASLRPAAAPPATEPPTNEPRATARNVMLGKHLLQRVELELMGEKGSVDVHLYEAYWAPFTEGEVKLRDVGGFLWRGAFHGIVSSFIPFIRWMFDTPEIFWPRIWATLGLLSAASLLAVLTLLNVLIPAVAAARLTFAERKGWPSDALLSDLTLLTGTFASMLLAIGLLVIVALWLKRHSASGAARLVRPLIHGLLAVLVALTAILAIPFALLLAYVVVRDSLCASPLLPGFLGLEQKETLAVWALLVLASLAARRVFVQYVGDVAAYVSPHVLDRFAELRKKIKDFVCDIGKAIYEQPGAQGEHLYDAVAIVGHSLGSVIAYDLLNRLIVEDTVGALPLPPMKPTPRKVLARTRILLTFGSPLDRTAFIFGMHGTQTGKIREVLAARVQPLIDSYAYRTFPWVNIHSIRDIISGSLFLYDLRCPPAGANTVTNVEDPDARIPLAAHIEYWHNRKLYSELHRAVAP